MPLKLRAQLDESSLDEIRGRVDDVFANIGHGAGGEFLAGLTRGLGTGGGAASIFSTVSEAAAGMGTGVAVAAGAAAAGVGLIVVAAEQAAEALYGVGERFDTLSDSISAATGKMGADLDAITESVNRVGANTASSLEDIAAIGVQLDQAFNLPQASMDALMKKIADFDRMTGETLNIREFGLALRNFGEEDRAVNHFNELYNVASRTGIPINELTGDLERLGPAAQNLGLNFQQTLAYIDNFNTAGIDAANTTMGLSHAAGVFASAGINMETGLRDTVIQMKALIDANNDNAALMLAKDVFGERGARFFFRAVKDGKLDVDTLNQGLNTTSDLIAKMDRSTADWAEHWQILKNRVSETAKEIGGPLFDAVNDTFGMLLDPGNLMFGGSGGIVGAAQQRLNDALAAAQAGGPPPGQVGGPGPGGWWGPTAAGTWGQPPQDIRGMIDASKDKGGGGTTKAPTVPYPPGYSGSPVERAQHDLDQAKADLGAAVASGDPDAMTAAHNRAIDAANALAKAQQGEPGKFSGVNIPAPAGLGAPPAPGMTAEQYSRQQSYLGAVGTRQTAEANAAALRASGTATPNDLIEAENKITEARSRENEALLRLNDTTEKVSASLGDIGAQLDQDFGISRGLPGIADNLTRFLANLAFAPAMGALAAQREAAGGTAGGGGLIGMAAVSGAFGPQFVPQAEQASALGPAALQPSTFTGLGANYPGTIRNAADAATAGNRVGALYAFANSLVGTPYSQPLRNDCSGMVSQIASVALGLPPPAAADRFTTVTEGGWLAQHGFQPGLPPPGTSALSIGWNPQPGNAGHTAATLPGGVNVEQGGGNKTFTMGPGAAGANSPQFPQHAWLPVPVQPFDGPGLEFLQPGITVAQNNTGQPQQVLPPGIPAIVAPAVGVGGGPLPGPAPIGGVSPNANWAPSGGAGGGGGMLGGAISAAASMFPGGGIAAQIAMQEIDRAIKAAGQYVGAGVGGLLETFLPAGGSQLASNSWLTRIAGGLAGMAPQLPNVAGKSPNAQQPATAAQMLPPPMPPPGVHTGSGAAPGPTEINVTYNNNGATEDRAAADLTYHLGQMNGNSFFAGAR